MKLLIASLLLPAAALAQTADKPTEKKALDAPVVQQVVSEMSGTNINSTTRTFNLTEITTKGTPMALTTWTAGSVRFYSGKAIASALINIDVINQDVWVKRSARDSALFAVALVKEVLLTSETSEQPIRYEHIAGITTDDAALKTGLVRVAFQGPYSLVQLPVKRFFKAPANQAYGAGQSYDEYRNESAYYIIRPDKTAERVKLNRKSLAGALQGKSAAFETVLKDRKLDAKIEADVVAALGAL